MELFSKLVESSLHIRFNGVLQGLMVDISLLTYLAKPSRHSFLKRLHLSVQDLHSPFPFAALIRTRHHTLHVLPFRSFPLPESQALDLN